jgi:hypothetical protein
VKISLKLFFLFLRRQTPIIVLLLSGLNAFLVYEVYTTKNTLKTISQVTLNYLDDLTYLNNQNKGFVDLSTPSFQHIGGTSGQCFFVSITSIDSHLNGVEVKGFIVNSSSLSRSDASFEISIEGQKQIFLIHNLNPGYRGYFKVFVPSVDINKVRYGYIVFKNSMVSYY